MRSWLGPLALLALGAGCVKRPIDLQRELAQTLRPAELQAFPLEGAGPPREPGVLKVRAWVDEDFQAQTPRWHERIAEQVRRANRVLEPQFGRRLELVDVVAWPRASRPPDLVAALGELRTTDPGRDVELVLGYVSALRMRTASTESLGMAEVGGRHLVLRAMVLEQEYDELERALDLLPADERDGLARERRVHREVAILLHEWGHTLGATHESLSASIMADVYHPQAVGFSPESARLIEAGLRASAQPASAAAPAQPAPPPRPAPPGPPAVASPRAQAAALPSSLRPRGPGTAGASADPRSPDSSFSLATLAEREAALKAGAAPPAAWLQLAREADRLGAPAVAERAARRAGGSPGAAVLASDALRLRREVALPLEGAVPAAREPEYVQAVKRVLEEVERKRLPKAREALRTLASAFPGSPGLALAECEAAAAEGVERACAAAVRAFEEAPRPHLLLGMAAGRAGRWTEARDQFRRALELDGSTGEAWTRLAAALGRLGEAGPLRDLEARYQARFGSALRPARD